MIIVIFGPPGAGKGTQSEKLSAHFGIPAFSTGEMFRQAMAAATPLGERVRAKMEAGDLVPDELVNELVAERMAQADCSGGVILDGYPRTVAQADVLDGWLGQRGQTLDHVLELVVDGDALIERRAGRLYAPISKKVYHERFNPPKVAGKCDLTGETLVHRDDDSPDVVRHRLQIYTKNTQPMLDHYARNGRLTKIDGMKSIDEVYAAILKVVG